MVIYYAGHGMQKNYTYMVLNENEGAKLYPLETIIHSLAGFNNCFIYGIFDCCREEFKEEDFSEAMRAGMGTVDEDDQDTGDQKGCWMLTFGCPPSKYTPAKSTLVDEIFTQMKKEADP